MTGHALKKSKSAETEVDSDGNLVGPLWIMISVFRERPENLFLKVETELWIAVHEQISLRTKMAQ